MIKFSLAKTVIACGLQNLRGMLHGLIGGGAGGNVCQKGFVHDVILLSCGKMWGRYKTRFG
jgi:hypothetical protein